MQTKTQIRELLDSAGLRPNKLFGQCFLVDLNLMGKLLELAELTGRETVLEIGPGTGSLTEELLERSGRVVAVEIDSSLAALLRQRLAGRGKLTLIEGDALAGKHELSPAVLGAIGERASLVSNLPYHAATPILAECLLSSWCSGVQRPASSVQRPPEPCPLKRAGLAARSGSLPVLFESMTFTVQREVADRFAAPVGSDAYGPLSILTALLGRVRRGPVVPATAFWPPPKVASRILRIDFDPAAAARVKDAAVLMAVVNLAFGQRRKQLRAMSRRKGLPFAPAALEQAMATARIDPRDRAEQISPEQYLSLATAVS